MCKPLNRVGWIAAAALLALPVGAIQPQRWTHVTEADFAPGEVDDAVVTNLGDIKLAPATRTLDALPDGVTIIYDIEVVGGVTYVAAGPEGRVLRVDDDEAKTIAAFQDHQVFSLDQLDGVLIAAVSGADSRIVHLGEDEPHTVARLDEANYIWDLLPVGDGFLAATGPEGKVYFASAQRVTEVLDTAQANILCLARHGDGPVYAGTDTGGLVYRLTPDGDGGYDAFVVYDAAEPEIGSLLVMADGTVYAGTADAEKARPGRLEQPTDEEAGRPADDESDSDADTDDDGNSDDDAEDANPADADGAGDAEDADAEADAEDAHQNDADTATDAAPTPEQRDALREAIRERLLAARKSGAIQPVQSRGGDRPSRPTRSASAAQAGRTDGNAVYRIDPDGFVTPVFRESVMILKLAAEPTGDDTHRLLVATGQEGQLYRVEPASGETAVVLDLDAAMIPALDVADGGTIVLGSGDGASLVTLASGIARRGVFTSQVLDANQVSLWGTFNLTADVPDGTSITVETRSGNVNDPEVAAWSRWSQAAVLMPDADASPLAPREIKIDAPPARFLQYRLTLTGDGQATPAVGKVELAYVMPNRRPALNAITAAYPDTQRDQRPSAAMKVEWEATDDNGDRLLYKIEYRPAGSQKWLPVADELTGTDHEWDTAKVPDGRYQLRVTASDRLDNPGEMAMTARRVSDPVVVDNTPPTLEALETNVEDGTVTVTGRASDALLPIASIAYSVDDDSQYTPVLPEDLIYDSTRERFVVRLPDSTPGPHVLTLRVKDQRGNTTLRPVQFEIE